MLVFPSVGDPWAVAPTCAGSVSRSQYCFSESSKPGDFVVVGVVGYKPAFSWEIFWQVRNDQSGEIYSGTYTTSLTFMYKLNNFGLFSTEVITLLNDSPDEISW